MSINNINNVQIQPKEVVMGVKEQPVDENQATQFANLTKEERQEKIKESNTRFVFDQIMSSLRRHTQEMQQQIKKQKEEDEA